MKLNLQHLNLRSRDDLDRWVEEHILALGEARQIDEANVRLEYHCHTSPPFAARIHLVTPGPDILAESCDHTIRAAFARALRQLKERIAARAVKPAQRARTRRSTPAAYSRGTDSHRRLN